MILFSQPDSSVYFAPFFLLRRCLPAVCLHFPFISPYMENSVMRERVREHMRCSSFFHLQAYVVLLTQLESEFSSPSLFLGRGAHVEAILITSAPVQPPVYTAPSLHPLSFYSLPPVPPLSFFAPLSFYSFFPCPLRATLCPGESCVASTPRSRPLPSVRP